MISVYQSIFHYSINQKKSVVFPYIQQHLDEVFQACPLWKLQNKELKWWIIGTN